MRPGSPGLARPVGRGDIVLVRFPFTDLRSTKLRPAVVLWADAERRDFLLAFIGGTDAGRIATGEVALLPTHPEFSLTGLSAPSKIRAAKMVTLSAALLRRWLGRLGPLLIVDLDRALTAALGINTAPYREEGRREERARLVQLHRAGGERALMSDLGLRVTG